MRKAEMEVTKAENMIEHGAEIFAKPARTWFQTQRQKEEVARLEKEKAAETPAQRSKREKDTGKNALKRKRGLASTDTATKKKSKLMQVRRRVLVLPCRTWQITVPCLACCHLNSDV